MKYVFVLVSLFFAIHSVLATEAVDVAVGDRFGCSLYKDGAVYCWGQFPVEGQEKAPFIAARIEDLPSAISIAAGRFGACAVDNKGALRCWGIDYQRSAKEDAPIASMKPFLVEGLPPVKSVTLGFIHMCALSTEGEVWCWGENPCGELGCGDKTRKIKPVKVVLPMPAISVSAGVNNTCAVLKSGQATCWGTDNPTMPGKPFIYETTEPVFLDPVKVGLFKQVSNGRNFACGITTKGKVTCWGSNIMGQIGTEKPRLGPGKVGIGEVDSVSKVDDLDSGYFGACAVAKGQVVCWGESTEYSAPEPIPGIVKATRVGIATSSFACVVDEGRVKCWGQGFAEDMKTTLTTGMDPDHPVIVPGLPTR